jgi:hypothetical protein
MSRFNFGSDAGAFGRASSGNHDGTLRLARDIASVSPLDARSLESVTKREVV